MSSLLKCIPLSLVVSDNQFVLKSVAPRYRFEDGKRTDKVDGYTYRLVSTETFDTFTVSVPHSNPVMTPEALRAATEAGQHILVELEDAVVTPYYSERTRSVEDSIKAAEIRRVGAK